jgi:hypothetical protein
MSKRPSFKNLFTKKPYGYWKQGDPHPILQRVFLKYKEKYTKFPEVWVKKSKFQAAINKPDKKFNSERFHQETRKILAQIKIFNQNQNLSRRCPSKLGMQKSRKCP